jgi:hypothetical protein
VSYCVPNATQVATYLPGSSVPMVLGQISHVENLVYSYKYPGGADALTCTLMVPSTWKGQAIAPGNSVVAWRGGHQVWSGKLDEPTPTAGGFSLTAEGAGNFGTDFADFYTFTWPTGQPDEALNRAITRGMGWVNPGQDSIPAASQYWFGQATDPASTTITDLLNLICTRGALGWYVNSQPGGLPGNDLTIAPLPTTPTRKLICTQPVGRTLGGYINSIYAKYNTAADDATTGAAATYATLYVQNAQSVAQHGVIETYIDLSDAGVMTSSAVTQICNYIFSVYQAASFNGPFTARQGQVTTMAGQAIDLGTEQAGPMYQLVLSDFAYGGGILPSQPTTFICGAYQWDDQNEVATITPYLTIDQSLSGLLSMENTILTPITAASS